MKQAKINQTNLSWHVQDNIDQFVDKIIRKALRGSKRHQNEALVANIGEKAVVLLDIGGIRYSNEQS